MKIMMNVRSFILCACCVQFVVSNTMRGGYLILSHLFEYCFLLKMVQQLQPWATRLHFLPMVGVCRWQMVCGDRTWIHLAAEERSFLTDSKQVTFLWNMEMILKMLLDFTVSSVNGIRNPNFAGNNFPQNSG